MAVGAFTDKSIPPSEGAIVASLWQALTARLSRGGAASELRFYGVNYGWALRYRRRGRALASLYPAEGALVAQIVLPAAAQRQVEARLRPATRAALARATAYREGKWLYLKVAKRRDLSELELLLDAKQAATGAAPAPPAS